VIGKILPWGKLSHEENALVDWLWPGLNGTQNHQHFGGFYRVLIVLTTKDMGIYLRNWWVDWLWNIPNEHFPWKTLHFLWENHL
jgi:hypothetical protein